MNAVLMALSVVIQPQPPVFPTYEKPLADQVTLTITTDRATYDVREPLRLRLTVRNVRTKPVHGYFVIDPDGPLVDFYYRRGGSEFVKLERGRSYGDYMHSPRTLQAGEDVTADGVIGFDQGRQRFLFDQSGAYEIKVIYRDVNVSDNTNVRLESDVIVVQVAAPAGGARKAQALFSKELALLAEYAPGVSRVGSEQIRAAIDFLDRFPDSPYSSTLREGLREALRLRVLQHLATEEEREVYERLPAAEQPPR
jgi:hypothetical protein